MRINLCDNINTCMKSSSGISIHISMYIGIKITSEYDSEYS